jgi:hypothetical protein
MPSGSKIDLMQSTFTKGVGSMWLDRAERRATVYGVLNNANHEALNDAINYLIATYGQFHHQDTSLPLMRIKTMKVSPTDVDCVLEYYRTRLNLTGFSNGAWRGTMIGSDWFRTTETGPGDPTQFDADGRPAGIMQFPHGGGKLLEFPPPVPWTWERPAVSHYVRFFIQTNNPIGAVAFRLGTTNNASVTHAGLVCAINTVLFESITIDVTQVLGTPYYEGTYDFTILKGGWVKQRAFFDTVASPFQWKTAIANIYPSTNFGSPGWPGAT